MKKREGHEHESYKDELILDEFTDSDLRTWKRISELSEEYHIKLFYHLESLRNIHFDELKQALLASDLRNVEENNWFRYVDYKYSNEPLSSKGSIKEGKRFNIGDDLQSRGFRTFPAFYIADSEETARQEKFGMPKVANGLEPHELALRDPGSFSAVRVKVSVENVFDLTKAKSLVKFTEIISGFQLTHELKKLAKELGMKPPYLVSKARQLKSTLLENSWRYYPVQHNIPSNSQLFGRMLNDIGIEAVLYPSVKHKSHKNLAIFSQNLEASDSHIKIQDEPPSGVKFTSLDSKSWSELF